MTLGSPNGAKASPAQHRPVSHYFLPDVVAASGITLMTGNYYVYCSTFPLQITPAFKYKPRHNSTDQMGERLLQGEIVLALIKTPSLLV